MQKRYLDNVNSMMQERDFRLAGQKENATRNRKATKLVVKPKCSHMYIQDVWKETDNVQYVIKDNGLIILRTRTHVRKFVVWALWSVEILQRSGYRTTQPLRNFYQLKKRMISWITIRLRTVDLQLLYKACIGPAEIEHTVKGACPPQVPGGHN